MEKEIPCENEDIAVTNFRRYLRINTVQPKPDYDLAAKFLVSLGEELELKTKVVEPVAGKPFVILTKVGLETDLPSLMLYSHTDVVPVFQEHWIHDPFGGYKDEKGDIYGRGSQDMKNLGIQYLEALRRLKKSGNDKFRRTIHLVYGPEEEIGGNEGMAVFADHEEFKALNIGFSLDEGIASEDDVYKVFYAERCIWWLKVVCSGNPGHASKFIENTAAEKFYKVVGKFLDFREEQRKKLLENPQLTMGDIVSVNLTKIDGGVQLNVVPASLTACFDIRVPPTIDFDELLARFLNWLKDVGSGIEHEFLQFYKIDKMTDTTDANPFWKAFSGVLDEMKVKYKKEIFIGATDSRFLRERGYGALNFSPMINTPQLLHDHNERLNEKVFLDGIQIYCQLISKLANV